MKIENAAFRWDQIRVVVHNDDGALWFQRELETQLAEEYRVERPEHEFANGGLLPQRKTVDALEGEIGFYLEYTGTGVAKWHTSGGIEDIPVVATERWRKSFEVSRMALGWQADDDDLARAQKVGLPLEMRYLTQVFDGLDRFLDDVAFKGDATKGKLGIIEHPNITVLEAASDAASSTVHRWTTLGTNAKTFEDMLDDIERGFRTMRAQNRQMHQPNEVWLPPEFWSRAGDVFRGTTDRTVQTHLREKYPNVVWRTVRRLGESGQYGGPTIFFLKRTTARDLWLEVPANKTPGEMERSGTIIKGFHKTYTGGVIFIYPLRGIRMDFPPDP